MKTTMIEKDKAHYIKKFKTLLTNGKIDRNAELGMLSAYGVESCKDMTIYELIELCQNVELMVNPELAELDKLRKRLMASIGGWRKAMGCTTNINEIKAIACRAAGISDFNHIPKERLNSLYNAFNHKTRDLNKVGAMTTENLQNLKNQN
jgi:hypothetical protein